MAKKKTFRELKRESLERKMAFKDEDPLEIEILVYDEKTAKRDATKDIQDLKPLVDKDKINLIIINNLTEQDDIDELGNFFGIHPMVMEDAISEAEIPSIQESGDQLLVTLKLIDLKASGDLDMKHIGLLLGEFYVIVFKDSENKVFNEIKARIENGKSKARQKKPDYLFYLLTDAVIDTYYSVVNEIDNKIDKMEAVLLEHPDTNYIRNLYRIKQPMSEMRSVVYPMREALMNMIQGDYPLIEDETLPFLHDVKDHINNIVTMFETSRDTLSDLLEINNSNINNRLNATMKMLTIITTLFVPLTLIAGIYGMNFRFMPELSWKVGYPMALGLMLVTAGVMLYIMKRNKLL
ncbi:MAG TPA: magnesium/cobalt transporter CorA [Bacteroidales bacterium]|nr:magnesium/cobalt transporter CorA [Bacteroidales bacterium]